MCTEIAFWHPLNGRLIPVTCDEYQQELERILDGAADNTPPIREIKRTLAIRKTQQR